MYCINCQHYLILYRRGIPLGNQAAPHCMWEGSLSGTLTDINEWINHWLRRWSFSLHRGPAGEHGGEPIYQGLWGRCVEESSGDGCLSLLGHWGVCWLGILRDSWRAPEREHLSLWELCYRGLLSGDLEGHGEEGTGDRHHSLWGPHWGIW